MEHAARKVDHTHPLLHPTDAPNGPPVPGIFVSGTDTGVGKTILSAALLAAIVASGRRARAYKPVVTGLDDPLEPGVHDHELLASLCKLRPEEVSPRSYGPAVSPHLASELAGTPLSRAQILADASAVLDLAGSTGSTLIVEGVGGLLVPLAIDLSVRELAAQLSLPLLIASRPSLGTINHTLLTLEAARDAGLSVAAVVLTPWPHDPSPLELSNKETIASLGEVEVAVLEAVKDISPTTLATAGETLPWQRWLT